MPSQDGLQNMAAAQAAYYYTLNKLSLGHANVIKDAVADPVREIKAANGVMHARREVDQALKERNVTDDDPYRRVQVMAEKAEKYQAGNCEEQSAVAFMFLRRLNTCKIDWCRWKVGYHAFVIVGRGGVGAYDPDATPTEPWFPDAVICDPQDKRWGYWSTLIKFYPLDNVFPMLHLSPQRMSVWKNQ